MATTNPWTAEIARVNAGIQQTQRNIARDQALLAANPTSPEAAILRRQIESGQEYLIELRAQLQIFQTEYNNFGKDATASSGQVVAEEAQARADNAYDTNPPSSTSTLVTEPPVDNQNIEFGTNGRIRSVTETQATPPNSPVSFNNNLTPATPNNNPGVGASTEDNTPRGTNATQQAITASFGGSANAKIQPKPNILDRYASYTYSVSWYLLTPDQYNAMMTTQKKNISGWQLLMQSGGAATQANTSNTVAGRNQYFSLDYYLDDLEIETLIPLKGTGMCHGASKLRFKVTEPNGITLLNNLYRAVTNLYKQQNVSKDPNYVMAQYCLAIRFYGYDANGNLIQVGNQGQGTATSTDPNAVVEKFYPFVITNIKFRIAKSAIEYMVDGLPIGHFYNFGQDRASIPFSFSLMGQTVGDVLIGKPVGTQYPQDDGRRNNPEPPPVGGNAGAAVDANGNFTGEGTAGSISSVIGA
jgi:hypothetical protein